jgi:8-oxo-dGTP diphosphatase
MKADTPVQVAAGVIAQDGRYLITRRKSGTHLAGLWEFPGGKREDGESLEECLRREAREELGIEITDPELFRLIRHDYPEKSVELYFFKCGVRAGEARAIGCDELRWVTPAELSAFEFPPADLPLVRALQNHG